MAVKLSSAKQPLQPFGKHSSSRFVGLFATACQSAWWQKSLPAIQGQWLVCGGQTELADHTVQFNTSLYTFDFATLSWEITEVGGEALQPRMEYMATCHQGSMVIMGGKALLLSPPSDPVLHYKLVNSSPIIVV